MSYELVFVTRDGSVFRKKIDKEENMWKGEAFDIGNNYLWVECVDESRGETVVLRTSEIVSIHRATATPW